MNAILIVETLIAFILAITIHEASHAAMATMLGDASFASEGRLSIAPRRHMAAIGTIVAIVYSISYLPAGLGWGKPVNADARRLSAGPNLGTIMVAVTGPLVNLFLGAGAAFVMRFLPGYSALGGFVQRCSGNFGADLQTCLSAAQPVYMLRIEQFVFTFAVTNIVLALINIIPLYPLDGYKVVFALLPNRQAITFRSWEPYMELLLLVLLFVLPYILGIVQIDFRPATLLIRWANSFVGQITGGVSNFYPML